MATAFRTRLINAPPSPGRLRTAVVRCQSPTADCPTGEYLASYWSNQMLSGLPALSRCEGSINNDFGTGSPPGVPADGFSARYEGRVNFDAGDYEFALTGDDGVRLCVDGVRVIDRWVDQAATTYRATRAMTAGVHDLRVDYYDASGQAVVRLAVARQVVPPLPPPPLRPRRRGRRPCSRWTVGGVSTASSRTPSRRARTTSRSASGGRTTTPRRTATSTPPRASTRMCGPRIHSSWTTSGRTAGSG